VLLIAGGTSAAGERAARSHTGALVSPSDAVDAACRTAGVLRVATPRELVDVAQLLVGGSRPRGRRLAIVSDGDPVFQPAKIARAGLAAAVEDRVLIYVHKEDHFEEIARLLPADRYVLVDDKASILARVKARLGPRAFTLHVAQGKYAALPAARPPDLTVHAIGDLLALRADTFA
jgi:FMN phosphatase YigB (HAD superfamily)